jgi:hypothetical protein
MTKTPEEIKAEARKLRNKPQKAHTGMSNTGHFASGKNAAGKGSQTTIKPARKPSV